MYLVTAAEMRELDRIAIQELGIPGVVLMEAAGRAVANQVAELVEEIDTPYVVVVSGRGNNGGDGYVAARHLLSRGIHVHVFVLAPREKITGDADTNLAILERLGAPITHVTNDPDLQDLREALELADVAVDALLGTGLKSEVRGFYAQVIEAINKSGAIKVSVDIPSGLHADTGQTMGLAVHADLTVTFGLPKIGLVTYPGAELAGEVLVADIGIPPQAVARGGSPKTHLLDETRASQAVTARPMGGHKGTFGHVLLVAGSHGKTGAALLAGHAASRAGAGLVTLAMTRDVQLTVQGSVGELMTAPYAHSAEDIDPSRTVQALTRLLEGKTALAAGPGIPVTSAMPDMLTELLASDALADKAVVLDADALNQLEGRLDAVAACPGQVVLTPHPGEAARLLGTTTKSIQADRLGAARDLAARAQALVVLKGARTVVAAPDGQAWLNVTGNPGLGSGGSGDVLTGFVAGLAAQRGIELLDAVLCGVYAHGLAADRVAERLGTYALTAPDLLEAIGPILSSWELGESVQVQEAES